VSVEELYDHQYDDASSSDNPFDDNESDRCSTRALVTALSTQATRSSSLIYAQDISMLLATNAIELGTYVDWWTISDAT
jgi:hypothetical protein